MYDSASPSRSRSDGAASVPAFVRDDSRLHASFVARAPATTRIDRLYSHGSLRLRMPRAHGICQAVLINTGGGIAGGDRMALDFAIGTGADVSITSQAAEKIYRAEGSEPASIATRMSVDSGARLDWLPQETILFDGSRLQRTLDVELDPTARLTLLESVVLGRGAHGETVQHGSLRDRWRIRRGGRLVLAEAIRLDGEIAAQMARAAIGAGARAMATLLHIAPDAEQRLDATRVGLADTSSRCGASAWNGCLVVRFLSSDPAALRVDAARAATLLTGRAMPRSWAC